MFEILRGGCNTRHPSSFYTNRPNGNSNWLLLLIKTPCNFILNEKEYHISPNTAIVISPGTPYFYQNPDGEYIDDWLHFNIAKSGDSFLGHIVPDTFFHVDDLDMYSFYIRHLLWENIYADSSMKEENIDCIMKVLFNHLSIIAKQNKEALFYNPYHVKMQQFRISIQSSPSVEHTADIYSQKLGISKSYFQHLYKELFGVAFNQDVIDMKIDYAKDLLETTDLSLSEISDICGYNNEVHFYRQFKEMNNVTPAKYRKHFRNQM